jgi:xanthine dehydrogenase iron-sulfur cluster and FAD-binding subunit A
VILDGRAVNACIVLAVELDGAEVTTIEGMANGAEPSRLQESFVANGAVQCGFCIPGMVMSAQALLERTPHPSEEEIREGLSGNLCRCGGYNQICAAVYASRGEATCAETTVATVEERPSAAASPTSLAAGKAPATLRSAARFTVSAVATASRAHSTSSPTSGWRVSTM